MYFIGKNIEKNNFYPNNNKVYNFFNPVSSVLKHNKKNFEYNKPFKSQREKSIIFKSI